MSTKVLNREIFEGMIQKPLPTFVNQTSSCLVEDDTSILDGVDRSEYEAFVYVYEVLSGPYKGWVYIGYHKLYKNEMVHHHTYNHSSTSEEFKGCWQKGEQIKRTILSFGSNKEMKNDERKYQDEYEKKGYNLFNKVKAGRGYRDPLFENPNTRKLVKRIEDCYKKLSKNLEGKNPDSLTDAELIRMGWDREIFESPTLKLIDYFTKSLKLQIRTEDDKENINDISSYVNDKGDSLSTDFILFSWIKNEESGEWEHVVNDGNCTGRALESCGQMYFKYLSLKKEFCQENNFNKDVLEYMGNVLNKKGRVSKPNSKSEIIVRLLSRFHNSGVPIDCDNNRILLQDDFGLDKGTTTRRINDAKRAFREEELAKTGSKIWNHDVKPDALNKKLSEISGKNTLTHSCKCTSTAATSKKFDQKVVELDLEGKLNDIHHVKIVLSYNDLKSYERYSEIGSTEKEYFEVTLRYIVTNIWPPIKTVIGGETYYRKRTYEVIYMDLYEPNITT